MEYIEAVQELVCWCLRDMDFVLNIYVIRVVPRKESFVPSGLKDSFILRNQTYEVERKRYIWKN
mgnify:CR=1 FL=1